MNQVHGFMVLVCSGLLGPIVPAYGFGGTDEYHREFHRWEYHLLSTLQVTGNFTDEYISCSYFAIGMENIIYLDVKNNGRRFASKEFQKLADDFFHPGWVVVKPPNGFIVKSFEVVAPDACKTTKGDSHHAHSHIIAQLPGQERTSKRAEKVQGRKGKITQGRQRAKAQGARKLKRKKGKRASAKRKNTNEGESKEANTTSGNEACLDTTLRIVVQNPGTPIYCPWRKRGWQVLLVSDKVESKDFDLHFFERSFNPRIVARGNWKNGLWPLKHTVTATKGEWFLVGRKLCAHLTNTSKAIEHILGNPEISVKLSCSDVAGPSSSGTALLTLTHSYRGSTDISFILDHAVEKIRASKFLSLNKVIVVQKPREVRHALNNEDMVGSLQRVFLQRYAYFLLGALCLAVLCAFWSAWRHEVIFQKVFRVNHWLPAFILSLSVFPAILGSVVQMSFGVIIGILVSGVVMLMQWIAHHIIFHLPFEHAAEPETHWCYKIFKLFHILRFVISSVMRILRLVIDFVFLKSVFVASGYGVSEIFHLDLQKPDWFVNFNWPVFIMSLPSWCPLRWQGLAPFFATLFSAIDSLVANCLTIFKDLQILSFVHMDKFAPCRELITILSTIPVVATLVAVYSIINQDMLMRFIRAKVLAIHKKKPMGDIGRELVDFLQTASVLFIQNISIAASEVIWIGIQPSDVDSKFGVLQDDACEYHWKSFTAKYTFYLSLFWTVSGAGLVVAIVSGAIFRKKTDDLITQKNIHLGTCLCVMFSFNWLREDSAKHRGDSLAKTTCSNVCECVQVMLGVWKEHDGDTDEAADSLLTDNVEAYNIKDRAEFITKQIASTLEKAYEVGSGDLKLKDVKEECIAETRELLVKVTAKEVSMALAVVPVVGLAFAKMIEYMNENLYCSSWKKGGRQSKRTAGPVVGSLWLFSVSRLLILFNMSAAPLFGLDFEAMQVSFAIGTLTCFGTSLLEILRKECVNRDPQAGDPKAGYLQIAARIA